MARQLGHVKYKGTIGEIRHFKIKGGLTPYYLDKINYKV